MNVLRSFRGFGTTKRLHFDSAYLVSLGDIVGRRPGFTKFRFSFEIKVQYVKPSLSETTFPLADPCLIPIARA